MADDDVTQWDGDPHADKRDVIPGTRQFRVGTCGKFGERDLSAIDEIVQNLIPDARRTGWGTGYLLYRIPKGSVSQLKEAARRIHEKFPVGSTKAL